MSEHADIAIIGGGPTGSALATFLARAGRDVLIVEQQTEPEMVVGESLLPFGNRVLEMLGIPMDGFIQKTGAVFIRDGASVRTNFSRALRPEWTKAHQVKRSDFDARCRAVARDAGVRWHYARATGADLPGTLHTTDGDVNAEWIVDAGGRTMMLARHLGIRDPHPTLQSAAIARHYRNVRTFEPEQPGDVTICSFEGGWTWLIPFADGDVSVGVVLSRDCRPDGDPWTHALAQAPDMAKRLEGAEPVTAPQGLQDFSAYASQFHGEGWALAGDAALFLDPVFSSGILLALESAERLSRHLLNGTLNNYEAEMRRAAKTLEHAILAFYDGSFLDVLLSPEDDQPENYRQAITSLLVGDVFDGGNYGARSIAAKFQTLAKYVKAKAAADASPD